MGREGREWGKRNRKKPISEENLTFLSEVEDALPLPHAEHFGSVSNKDSCQKPSYSVSPHTPPQGAVPRRRGCQASFPGCDVYLPSQTNRASTGF